MHVWVYEDVKWPFWAALWTPGLWSQRGAWARPPLAVSGLSTAFRGRGISGRALGCDLSGCVPVVPRALPAMGGSAEEELGARHLA